MPIVLARIDDRLIHGQVVEGWLPTLNADRIVVASDQAAGDPIQTSLMGLALPPEVALTVLKVEDAARALTNGDWTKERVMLLLPGIGEARRLVEAGAKLPAINLGGLHDAPGRRFITPSIAISDGDRKDLQALLALRVELETRALPTDERRSVADLLQGPEPKETRERDIRPQ